MDDPSNIFGSGSESGRGLKASDAALSPRARDGIGNCKTMLVCCSKVCQLDVQLSHPYSHFHFSSFFLEVLGF